MEKPGEILISRIYDSEGNDGKLRILIDRLWPRGISHENAALDQSENFANFGPQKGWAKNIAPSAELREWFGHESKKWPEFREKYLTELNENPLAITFRESVKNEILQGKSIELLYSGRNEVQNNAVVLKNWLENLIKK